MQQDTPILQRLFGLRGNVALVTGASGGLGRAIAQTLAEAGAVVGLHGTRQGELEGPRDELVARGMEAVALPADLRDVAECRRLVAAVHSTFGRLDILVNCAGINRRNPIADVSEDDFDAVVEVNLRALFFLSQAAQPIMRDQGGGKIINVGSVTSVDGLADVSIYGATKAAVAQLTRTMAIEWARDNIQVNCLAPGFMVTPLTEGPLWGDEWRRKWLLERIPARRPGQPDDLSGAVLLLASPASAYMTGHTIAVDGGYLVGGSWQRDER